MNNFYLFYCAILFNFFLLIFLEGLNATLDTQLIKKTKLDLGWLNMSLFITNLRYMLNRFLSYFIIYSKTQFVSHRQFRFVGLFFTIFVVIFLFNVLSLIAFNPSITGHLIVTLLFSISLFLGFIIIGFLNYDGDYFSYFVPKDVPKALLPFLILIEILSFFIRPFSLGIRLFANMLAGHTLMGIFAKFGIYVVNLNVLLIFFPILLIVPVLFLEIGVALVQSYIFINLLYIYMNDVYIIEH